MAKEAGTKALDDAGIPYSEVEQAVVGYVYGESTCGQRAVYQLGLTGIPVYNVNNNCSTGSTALFMGKQLVEGGLADCVLALGFEKMQKGSLGADVHGPHQPDGPARERDGAAARIRAAPAGGAALRKRGPRAHGEVRLDAAALREDRATRTTSTRSTTLTRSSRTSTASRTSSPRRWCTSRSPSSSAARRLTAPAQRSSRARSSSRSTTSRTRRSRSSARRWSPTSEDTFDSKSSHQAHRQRDDAPGREPGLRAHRPRPGERGRHRAPRLLLGERDDHVRGSRPRARGQGAHARRTRTPSRTAARSW